MIRLTGIVTAHSPITVSYPDYDGLPRTPHGEVVLFGGTVRGPLRKCALHAVRRRLAKARGVNEDTVFSVADHYMLGQGVDVARTIDAESSAHIDPVAEKRLREANPLLDLFGRWKLAGRLSVGELRADEGCLMKAGAGARVDMFERDNNEIEFLDPAQQAQLIQQLKSERMSHLKLADIDGEIRALSKESRGTTDDEAKKAITAKIASLREQKKAQKDMRDGAKESVKHPLNGFESIAPGTEMTHKITLHSADEAALGLLLSALGEFSHNPYIGGHRASGCGEISASYRVDAWAPGDHKPAEIGTICFNQEGFRLEGSRLEQAINAFESRIAGFDFTRVTREPATAKKVG